MRPASPADWSLDSLTHQLLISDTCRLRLGLVGRQFSLSHWLQQIHPNDQGRVQEILNQHQRLRPDTLTYEARALSGDHQYRWYRVEGHSSWDEEGHLLAQTGCITDITEAKHYDCLTGLPNHFFLENWLQREQPTGLLAIIGIGQLPQLQQVCSRSQLEHLFCMLAWHFQTIGYRDVARDKVIVMPEYRLGIVIQQPEDKLEAWLERSQGYLQLLSQQLSLPLLLTLDLGHCPLTAPILDAECIIRDAELALRHGQSHQLPMVQFTEELRHAAQQRITVEQQLRQGLADRSFHWQWQPILALAAPQESVYFEVLVRWPDQRQPISPEVFVPIAEELQLIEPLFAAALDEAARWLNDGNKGPDKLKLAINVSARQFDHDGLPRQLRAWLQAHPGIGADQLCLEITETAILKQPKAARLLVNEIKALGFAIALDDFGSGYAALALLADLPLDRVKIDKGLLSSIDSSPKNRALMQGIIHLCHSLGYQVVAEGIESEQQLALLHAMGCDFGQGYLLAKPLWPTDVTDWLATRGDTPGKKKQA